MTDPIADMLTRIRNAIKSSKESVEIENLQRLNDPDTIKVA